MTLDEMNNTMPPEELKELNERNDEEKDIIYHNLVSKHAQKNEEMQNSTSKEYGELIALRDARRKILELYQQES